MKAFGYLFVMMFCVIAFVGCVLWLNVTDPSRQVLRLLALVGGLFWAFVGFCACLKGLIEL